MTRHKILLVGSEKGGVGKTSIALNLSVMRARAGHPVLLVDADKQASAAMWCSLRSEGGFMPPLVCVQKLGRIGADLVQLSENYEICVDAGGSDSVELRHSIAVADIWLMPERVGQLDLFVMAKMAQILTDIKERMGRSPSVHILLNAVPPSTKEAEEAREALTEFEDFPVLDSMLVERVTMRRAVRLGCAVVELTGKNLNPACVQELMQVYEEIYGEPYVDKATAS